MEVFIDITVNPGGEWLSEGLGAAGAVVGRWGDGTRHGCLLMLPCEGVVWRVSERLIISSHFLYHISITHIFINSHFLFLHCFFSTNALTTSCLMIGSSHNVWESRWREWCRWQRPNIGASTHLSKYPSHSRVPWEWWKERELGRRVGGYGGEYCSQRGESKVGCRNSYTCTHRIRSWC